MVTNSAWSLLIRSMQGGADDLLAQKAAFMHTIALAETQPRPLPPRITFCCRPRVTHLNGAGPTKRAAAFRVLSRGDQIKNSSGRDLVRSHGALVGQERLLAAVGVSRNRSDWGTVACVIR